MVFETPFIKADALSALSGIDHAYFTRKGGISGGLYASRNVGLGSDDAKDAVLENRARCAADLAVAPDRLATVYQIHSPDVVTVDEVWQPGSGPKADAMVTKRRGVMIGIATADCGPVLFADPKAGVIGAAHAGWRGATGGVLENTLTAMEKLGADRANVTAILGPTIAQKSYEVGPEFVAALTALSVENMRYLIPSARAGHALFDLPSYITDRLAAAGVGQTGKLDLDTYDDETRFYSYRRTTHRAEPDYGRLLSAIVLKN